MRLTGEALSGRQGEIAEQEVVLEAGGALLEGTLALPRDALGLVVFAHGSGSGRFSPRNRYVAERLRRAGLGTLLMDLLTREEEVEDEITRAIRFDIDLLARRVVAVIDDVRRTKELARLPIGTFGASTGAAAALIAAAERPDVVGSVVSRGGRPDLAGEALPRVRAPTLLIVGELDFGVIELNERALAQLAGEKRIEIVDGATHLFEEPGALDEVARLAAGWFAGCFEQDRPGARL